MREREAFLRDNSDEVVEMGYMKPFDTDKVSELKERLSEVSIEISEVEAEKKAATTQFNAQLKPMQEEKATILRGIKERAEYVKEECYKFIDNDEKMVGYYNSEGLLIESRPARPSELQSTIHQELRRAEVDVKTGTNN